LIILPGLVLLAALPISGQEIQVQAGLASREIRVSANFRGPEIEEVLDALGEGFKSEIVYQFRLYERKQGFFAYFGDRLIFEKNFVRLAYRDLFEQQFVIESRDERRAVKGEAEFVAAFFRLSGFLLAGIREIDVRDYYVLARIRVQPVRLVSPLNIVTLFSRQAVTTTPWLAVDILDQGSIR
jgi:hypothetical protein